MANPFMPSVAGSLNMAGQDTLQQLLQRRMMEEQLAARQQQMQMQAQQQMIGNLFRARADARATESLEVTKGNAARMADAAKAREKADNAKLREEDNKRGVALMATEMVRSGAKREDVLPYAVRAGNQFQSWMMPERPKAPKPTLEEDIARRKALRTADKEVDARFKEPTKPKAPKAADLKAPPELRSEIESYATRKLPGWRTVEEAKKSIEANWPKLRAKYGTLEKSAMDAALVNIYGTRPKTQDRLGELMQMIEAQAKPTSDE